MPFVKIYQTILDSSIWMQPHATRVVWVTMLAMGNEHGVVEMSPIGLAARARVSMPEIEAALAYLSSPDEYSKSKEYEGRRIEDVPSGWLILNHKEYREHRTSQQILTAERVKLHRKRKEASALAVTHPPTYTETEAEAKKEKELKAPAKVATKKKKEIKATHQEIKATHQWIADQWNTLPDVNKCRTPLMTATTGMLNERLKEHPLKTWWEGEFFPRIRQSSFLRGKSDLPFVATLGWALGKNNCAKIIEDLYKDKPQGMVY